MVQSGMRITVDAAMRARDVSKPSDDAPGTTPPPGSPGPEPATPPKPRKGERRRLGKRAAAQRTLDQGSGGSSPVSS